MDRNQKLVRLSNAQQILARRTSELFEPGQDPYNSADTLARKASDMLELAICGKCGNTHHNPGDSHFCSDTGEP